MIGCGKLTGIGPGIRGMAPCGGYKAPGGGLLLCAKCKQAYAASMGVDALTLAGHAITEPKEGVGCGKATDGDGGTSPLPCGTGVGLLTLLCPACKAKQPQAGPKVPHIRATLGTTALLCIRTAASAHGWQVRAPLVTPSTVDVEIELTNARGDRMDLMLHVARSNLISFSHARLYLQGCPPVEMTPTLDRIVRAIVGDD